MRIDKHSIALRSHPVYLCLRRSSGVLGRLLCCPSLPPPLLLLWVRLVDLLPLYLNKPPRIWGDVTRKYVLLKAKLALQTAMKHRG
jgi:hypothetical protein